jgi:hypothetical protein
MKTKVAHCTTGRHAIEKVIAEMDFTENSESNSEVRSCKTALLNGVIEIYIFEITMVHRLS